jgi:hypothetical protein
MTTIADIPQFEVEPEGSYEPRRVSFTPVTDMGRRGFLGVLGAGGMALGMSMLSWVPVGRKAHAAVGTEYTTCSIYSYDGVICVGAPYSSSLCGSDKWFKNGCFRAADNYTDCYRPKVACNGRNAWRWSGYRCADGEVRYYGTSIWLFRICSAAL